jgi:hypothetical protein
MQAVTYSGSVIRPSIKCVNIYENGARLHRVLNAVVQKIMNLSAHVLNVITYGLKKPS